ncbi:MAG: hypothetical protein MUE72_13435, partial [Chitinophagaceae bacterium]|nr:hypothetical protein [Chitinophagaceae bacterium]
MKVHQTSLSQQPMLFDIFIFEYLWQVNMQTTKKKSHTPLYMAFHFDKCLTTYKIYSKSRAKKEKPYKSIYGLSL